MTLFLAGLLCPEAPSVEGGSNDPLAPVMRLASSLGSSLASTLGPSLGSSLGPASRALSSEASCVELQVFPGYAQP